MTRYYYSFLLMVMTTAGWAHDSTVGLSRPVAEFAFQTKAAEAVLLKRALELRRQLRCTIADPQIPAPKKAQTLQLINRQLEDLLTLQDGARVVAPTSPTSYPPPLINNDDLGRTLERRGSLSKESVHKAFLEYRLAQAEVAKGKKFRVQYPFLRNRAVERFAKAYEGLEGLTEFQRGYLQFAVADARKDNPEYFYIVEEEKDGQKFYSLKPTEKMLQHMWRQAVQMYAQTPVDMHDFISPPGDNAFGWFLKYGLSTNNFGAGYNREADPLTGEHHLLTKFLPLPAEELRKVCELGHHVIRLNGSLDGPTVSSTPAVASTIKSGLTAQENAGARGVVKADHAKPTITPLPQPQLAVGAKPTSVTPEPSKPAGVSQVPPLTPTKPTVATGDQPKPAQVPQTPPVTPAKPDHAGGGYVPPRAVTPVQPQAAKPVVVVPPARPNTPVLDVTPTQPPAVQEAPAAIIATVHDGTLIWIDGNLTSSVGTVRRFNTPDLELGKKFTYTMTLKWGDYTHSQIVTVEGGKEAQVVWLPVIPRTYVVTQNPSPCAPGFFPSSNRCGRR